MQATRRTTILLLQILAVGAILLGAGRVSGEPFLDLYGGVAQTESARVTASHRDCDDFFFFAFCGPETKATRDVGFDPSATYGIRGGYWFERVPWVGLAGDLSYFEAKGNDARFQIIPFSLLVMFRLPLLTTDEIPKGRLQPYVGLGPSFIYQKAMVDVRPEVEKKVGIDSVEVGLDVRAGLTWQFHRRVGVFAEYRFTHVSISADDEGDFSVRTERVDATLNTHHFLAGVSIRF